MYCKKYRCTMSEVACKLRRDNSLICNDRGVAVYKPGYSDVGCATCQQGKEVAASIDPAFVKQHAINSRRLSTKAIMAFCRKKAAEERSPVPRPPKYNPDLDRFLPAARGGLV